MLNIVFEDKKIEVAEGKTYHELALEYEKETGKTPYLVLASGIVKELRRHVKEGEEISFLYPDDDVVMNSYARTAIFILLKAIYEYYSKKYDARLKFRVQNSYYFEMDNFDITESDVAGITKIFKDIVSEKFFIEKNSYAKKDAIDIFRERKMDDAILLFRYMYRPVINLRSIDDYIKYINGTLLYHTGYITNYEIRKYNRGIIFVLPDKNQIDELVYKNPGEKFFNIHNTTIDWAKKLNINSVGKLNEEIALGHINDLVIMTESYQDKQIGDIAELIKHSNKKLIFVAGPSCSGKTSFSHRLMYHLRALELNPHPIACDDFFKTRENTPKKENGDFDFENIEAVDIELLNDTLKNLLDGKEVMLPKFNFTAGSRDFSDKGFRIEKNDIIIFEGIHCLNKKLTPYIDDKDIFKIYISALTEVCIDNANRIATSDLRLIRRLVRDQRTRGFSPKETLKRWKDVREGEEKYIFPYQEDADVLFNSALIYEFSALKLKALPALYRLTEDVEVAEIAKRLIKILNYFLAIDTDVIPKQSLVREFIGNSILDVG